MTAGAKGATLYRVHPGVAMVQKWVCELKAKTGRSLEEWIALSSAGEIDAEVKNWLKTAYDLDRG
jgi:Domain of unknown function (DUF4287)